MSENTTLTADKTVDALTVEEGVTLDLNGYKLYCTSLAGSGTITSLSGTTDLTSPDTDGTHVTWSTNGGTAQTASGNGTNLFNNTTWTKTDVHNNAKRIMVATANLPLAVTYDFGEGTTERVNKYNIYFGSVDYSAYNNRGPKDWVFEGSNGNDVWTKLDTQTGITWENLSSPKSFSFENATPYRYYRITFTASKDTNYLELNMLEYFNTNPGELHVNVADGQTLSSSVTISGNVKVVKEGAGTLGGVTKIASGSGATVALVVDGGNVLTDSNLYISENGGAGTLTINSGLVEITGDNNAFLNPNDNTSSIGTINLNAGGTLKTRRIFSKAAARGALNFDGGTLQQNKAHTISGGLIAAATTVNVLENGGTIHSGNYAVTVGATIGGTGAMRFKGGNTITLSGASTYTGGTTIELGTKITTSNATAKETILANLVIDGKSQLTDATGIEVFQYDSALTDPDDRANVTLVNCGAGSAARIDGAKIVVDFVAPTWELSDNATWSDLVATYGTPAADATVRIAVSAKYMLTINTDVTVAQISFTGMNPNVVVNSGCTVTADTISFGGSGTSYLKNDGVVVLNDDTTLPFHNDSRGVYYVNNAGKLKVSSVTQGSTTPGLLPEGTNQFVCVASGAMYNMNGIANNTVSVRLAAGATVANGSETSVTSSNKQIPQLILDGDATAKVYHSFGLIGTGRSETRLDLGEHTLTITGGGNTYSLFLDNTTVSGTGKILVSDGRLAVIDNTTFANGTLEIGPSGYLAITKYYGGSDSPFTVNNFVNNGTDSSDSTAGALIVTGTLTPGNDIKKLTLAGGSSIKASTTTKQTVTTAFSASGTVTIDASDVTAQQLKDATDGRIAVLTAPGDAAMLNASATWRVSSEPISGSRAKWISNGDSTSTLYLSRPTGLMLIFR